MDEGSKKMIEKTAILDSDEMTGVIQKYLINQNILPGYIPRLLFLKTWL